VNVLFTVDAPPVTTEETIAAGSDEGDEDLLPLAFDRAQFCARVDARSQVRPGGPIRLVVDPSRFHFFDVGTGRAIESRRTVAASA
jgi:multiple sugar transport system ATP-binding protein